MADHLRQSHKYEQLRCAAEQLIKQRPDMAPQEPTDILELIQELRVYEAELEIQNEELRRAQHEISALKQEYENLYELAPCAYITLNPKGRITRINLTGVTLLGVVRDRIQRTNLSQFIAKDFQDLFFAARKKAGETGEKQHLEIPLKKGSGEPLWVRTDIEAERGQNGEVLQWRIMMADISERLQREAEQKKMKSRLQQAGKMQALGTLAGGIAHEFNNMLAIILGNVELAMFHLPETSPATGSMQEALIASLRAKDVVKQLLAFTHMDIQHRTPLQLKPVFEEALKLMRLSTPANIEIVCDIQEGLYPVMANPTHIQQILINLCSNAADAMLAENGIINIRLDNADLTEADTRHHPNLRPGRYVKWAISDTGIGMDEDTQLQIFDPFFTTKAIGKGTGMGLAVVHGIVEKHGGTIIVESHPGSGSTFTLFFPETVETAAETPSSVAAPRTGSERIMFIDDEMALTKLGQRHLEQLGYGVETFTKPLEAFKRFASAPEAFDLIITDMTMPNMTGEQLITEMRRIRLDIPIILCTGFIDRLDAVKTVELGIQAYLLKPYRMKTLANTVFSALSGTKN